MYPNFDNKQDQSSKRQALLESIERDQRLDKIKRAAYANAIWASDSDENKLKDATESGDTISRIIAAIKASSSSEKRDPSVFSNPYDLMGDANDHLMSSEDVDATTDEPMMEAPMEAPMMEKPMEDDLMEEKAEAPDNSAEIRDDIKNFFAKHPYLSGLDFKPIIVRNGQIQEHEYFIRHTDGYVINKSGNRIKSNNALLSDVDWRLTWDSIQNKASRISRGAIRIENISSDARIKRLFNQWKAFTLSSINQEEEYANELGMLDDQNMEDMSVAQRLDFDEWLGRSENDLEMMDLMDETRKRPLEDSAVSMDTRVVKKTSEYKNMTNRAKVQFLYDNIDELDQIKLRPYVKIKGEIKQTDKTYLGHDMKVIMVETGKEVKNQRIDWDSTLNYVIGESATGARALSIKAQGETDENHKLMLESLSKHIIEMITIVDPKQGEEEAALINFESKSFETPLPKGRKLNKSISAPKRYEDYTYNPPAEGKGLIGRGLRGAGSPRRSYNLADIEGSGKASDLKYKRIGTKFIRKADLHNNRLKLVYPNRTGVGPIRAMSDELTQMVKDLLFNDNINQQSYQALPIEDQRVFYEIVRKTHVDHTLQTPMVDPRITLKAEFDKLCGEISLGNDNPEMMKELYRLATDMFDQKMISKSEFKSIMSALL